MNTTTKTLWANVNGVWTDLHIRAYYDSIPVWVNGVFGIGTDNGTHNYASSSQGYPFTIVDTKLVRDGSTYTPGTVCTLTSTELIDFTGYQTITVKNDKTRDVVVNVSGLNGSGYLFVYAFIGSSYQVVVGAGVSTQRDNFHSFILNNLVKEETVAGQAQGTIRISEITIE